MTQDKAQHAVNGRPLSKGWNAGLCHFRASLRAQRETVISGVAYRDVGQGRELGAVSFASLEKGTPFSAMPTWMLVSTIPWMESIESSREQRPRTTQEQLSRRVLQLTASRYADMCPLSVTLH